MAKKTQHGGKRIGAGRKPVHPEGRTVTVAATVPEGLVERLDLFAERREWNRSKAITEAIRGLLATSEKLQRRAHVESGGKPDIDADTVTDEPFDFGPGPKFKCGPGPQFNFGPEVHVEQI